MKHVAPHIAVALLTSALNLQASADVQLLPAGEFAGRDGRPGKGLTWKLSDQQGRALAARLNERHQKVHFNFDYEHQAMLSEDNGQPAPASGWSQQFAWRDGEGLYALNVQWTSRARQMIEGDEYRYLSPVITYDKRTGQVVGIANAALTNIPNLELSAVGQELMAKLSASFSNDQENPPMNEVLQALLKALGLADDVSKADAELAVANLKTKAAQADTLTTEVAALKAKGTGEPDPTKWVGIDSFNALNTEVATLKAKNLDREVDELIEQALNSGKLVPAAEPVWRNVGKADIAQLRELVKSTPATPALAGRTQTNGTPPAGSTHTNDAEGLRQAALKYQREQRDAGNEVSYPFAVEHVANTQQGA